MTPASSGLSGVAFSSLSASREQHEVVTMSPTWGVPSTVEIYARGNIALGKTKLSHDLTSKVIPTIACVSSALHGLQETSDTAADSCVFWQGAHIHATLSRRMEMRPTNVVET